MASESAQFLSTLHKNIDKYFSFSEVKTLCFEMGVDYDNVPGDSKTVFVRNLIVSLARQNRLQELVDKVRGERNFVVWQDVPVNFELPTSVAQEDVRQVVQYTVYGDVVQGDKIGGDKVSGDKISVGNISGSSNVAIGSGAKATTTNEGDTFNMSGDFRGAMVNVKSTLTNVQQTIGSMATPDDADKQALQDLVKQLEAALAQVPEAQGEDAEAVSQTTEALINLAAAEKPNKTMLKITGEGLKQAAKNLAAITPDVLTIATGIVMTIGKIAGMG